MIMRLVRYLALFLLSLLVLFGNVVSATFLATGTLLYVLGLGGALAKASLWLGFSVYLAERLYQEKWMLCCLLSSVAAGVLAVNFGHIPAGVSLLVVTAPPLFGAWFLEAFPRLQSDLDELAERGADLSGYPTSKA